MITPYDTSQTTATPPELDLLAHKLKQLLSLLATKTEHIRELQNTVAILEKERDTLLAEREGLTAKLETARLHVKSILEHLPQDT